MLLTYAINANDGKILYEFTLRYLRINNYTAYSSLPLQLLSWFGLPWLLIDAFGGKVAELLRLFNPSCDFIHKAACTDVVLIRRCMNTSFADQMLFQETRRTEASTMTLTLPRTQVTPYWLFQDAPRPSA